MSAPKSGTKYTSKGEREANRKISKAIKRDRTAIEKWMILQKAWLAGKNPWVTIDNPNTAETAKRKIRVRAETEWGDPRKGYMQGAAKD